MGTYAVLSHAGSFTDMDLHLQLSMSGTKVFEVSSAIKSAGGAQWKYEGASEGASEVISMDASSWILGGHYAFYASYKQKMCNGYGKKSNAQLPGGSAGEINCVGDCVTGKGYCYSSDDGEYCAQCVLHGTGGPLCTDYGIPQGDEKQLPGGSEFGSTCQEEWKASGGPAKIDMPCSGRVMTSSPTLRLFAKGKLVQRVPLAGSLLQEGAGGSRAEWFMCVKAKDCPLGCSEIESVPSIEPVAQINARPGLTSTQYSSLVEGTLPAQDQCDSRALENTATACSTLACVLDSTFYI